MENFAKQLKTTRISSGFTQKDFALKIGVNPSSYRNWENAVTLPTFPNFQKIIKGFQSIIRSGKELTRLNLPELKESFITAKGVKKND